MVNKLNNQRALETKRIITESFLSLLKSRPISQITVTAIAKKACINRSTFYQHYLDVYDLLEKISHNFIVDLTQTIYLNSTNDDLKNGLVKMLNVIQSHKIIASICLANLQNDKKISHYFEDIRKTTFQIFRSVNSNLSDFDCELKYTFFAQGSISVILKWLNEPNDLSVDRIAQLLVSLYI